MKWFIDCLKKYAVFEGRSHRTEYWMFTLVVVVINIVLSFLQGTDLAVLASIFSLAVLIPSIAVSVRRLHDINRSGWWLLLSLIPIVGWLILLVWAVRESDKGENRFGQPLGY